MTDTSPFGWNDGEVVYCAGLVALGGVPSVPGNSIPDYIKLQMTNAERQNRPDVVAELQHLLDAYHFSSLIDGVMALMKAESPDKGEVN